MALSELTSNLSWYGSNAGFRAQQSANQTRFNQDPEDLSVIVAPRGFDNAGNQSNAFMAKMSGNAFNIDGQGTATRLSQLGNGTKFPIGPAGQVHEFDIKRTGFSERKRYADTFDNKTLKGLANTYTAKSPIDDMYNKFVVRDEAWNPAGKFSLANIVPAIINAVGSGLNSVLNTSISKIDLIDTREPYILTGIQREGKSDPQRYGLFSTSRLEIPRGGALTFTSRLLRDVVRVGKFLSGPHGIEFTAKQQALHLQTPNLESKGGFNISFGPNKLYNPISPILNLAAGAGIHFGNQIIPRKYESVILKDRIDVKGVDPLTAATINNRLTGLRDDLLWNPAAKGLYFNISTPINSRITRLSALNGPAPDLVFTTINRYTNTIPGDQLIQVGFGGSNAVNLATYLTNSQLFRYFGKYKNVSTRYSDNTEFGSYASGKGNDDKSPLQRRIYDKPEVYKLETGGKNYKWQPTGEDFLGGVTKEESTYLDSTNPETAPPVADSVKYKALSYGKIRTARKGRTYKTTEILDPSTGTQFSAKDTTLGKKLTQANAGPTADKDKTLVDLYTTNDDLVTFKIGDEIFRAYISSISLSDNASSAQQKEMMAPYPQYYFDSHDRTGSVSFVIAALSPAALTAVWNKIKKLQSLCGPSVSSDTSGALRIKTTTLTVGNIFDSTSIIIDSISFDIDTESPWEITPGYQRPMYVNIDISFTVLPTSKTSLPTFS